MAQGEWPDSWRAAFRIELRAEAISLAWRGWPVLPGTYPTGLEDRERDASPGAHGDRSDRQWVKPVPVHEDWQRRLGAHPQQVAGWWTGESHSLLVATGRVVDAIEVDDDLGRRAAMLLRAMGQPAPIVAMPNGRWLFLTTVAEELPTALVERSGVEWHGDGSWIPLPPTPFQHGVVHWRVKPEIWGWRLPEAETVHAVLVRALRSESGESAAGEASLPAVSARAHPVTCTESSAA